MVPDRRNMNFRLVKAMKKAEWSTVLHTQTSEREGQEHLMDTHHESEQILTKQIDCL